MPIPLPRVMIRDVTIGLDVSPGPLEIGRQANRSWLADEAEKFLISGSPTVEGEHLGKIVPKRNKRFSPASWATGLEE